MHATTTTAFRRALTHTGAVSALVALWVLTGAVTLLGTLIGAMLPALAPGGTPHPTLHGTSGDVLSIFTHNLRVLAAPLILSISGWASSRITRAIGDALVIATFLVSPLVVGVAIGRYGSKLLIYLPHLPIEWGALSVAAGAWLAARGGRASARALVAYTGLTVALAAIAAVVETVAIPQVG
jgi:hypothetical protein